MEKKQSFVKEAVDDFEVLLDGSKNFWRWRICLDVLIVSHPRHMCYELVAYNAVIGVEAPRLYISSVVLAAKINPDRVESEDMLLAEKEVFLRQRNITCNVADFSKLLYNELVISYILQRLNIVTEDIDLTKELRVQLTPIRHQKDMRQYVICSMPANLQPIKSNFTKIER
jgi:hypothetical protein